MAETSEKGVIRAQALAKHYDAKVAVQDVSLTLEAGEIVGLLGPNGAGKTTTVRILTTLLKADGGTALGPTLRRVGERLRRKAVVVVIGGGVVPCVLPCTHGAVVCVAVTHVCAPVMPQS